MKWEYILKDYLTYLKLERGLSVNSISSYELDLIKLINFLKVKSISASPLTIDQETLQLFLYEIAKELNSRSRARIISGLKSFFNYLIFEDYRKDNPTDLIEAPKIGRKLPETISVEEIDELIAAIDLTKTEGERNRAIIETLYGCGLRVSELTNLRISDLYFEEGFIKVTGKGDKQRFVPISDYNIKYITSINSLGNGLMVDVDLETVTICPKNGFGGVGGVYCLPTALANVRQFYTLCPRKTIVGCGGVMSGRDAFSHILCGASAVQIGTALCQQ